MRAAGCSSWTTLGDGVLRMPTAWSLAEASGSGLRFRDLLARSVIARGTYEKAKQCLAEEYPEDRQQYTAGKDATVQRLLDADA